MTIEEWNSLEETETIHTLLGNRVFKILSVRKDGWGTHHCTLQEGADKPFETSENRLYTTGGNTKHEKARQK